MDKNEAQLIAALQARRGRERGDPWLTAEAWFICLMMLPMPLIALLG